jgi:hypothetical protein
MSQVKQDMYVKQKGRILQEQKTNFVGSSQHIFLLTLPPLVVVLSHLERPATGLGEGGGGLQRTTAAFCHRYPSFKSENDLAAYFRQSDQAVNTPGSRELRRGRKRAADPGCWGECPAPLPAAPPPPPALGFEPAERPPQSIYSIYIKLEPDK